MLFEPRTPPAGPQKQSNAACIARDEEQGRLVRRRAAPVRQSGPAASWGRRRPSEAYQSCGARGRAVTAGGALLPAPPRAPCQAPRSMRRPGVPGPPRPGTRSAVRQVHRDTLRPWTQAIHMGLHRPFSTDSSMIHQLLHAPPCSTLLRALLCSWHVAVRTLQVSYRMAYPVKRKDKE